MSTQQSYSDAHSHVFLGEGHDTNERRTWIVIWLCGFMMCAEIVGGYLFGSIALVADGLHMSTHASALLLTALAYRYARRYADDRRFTFGTGKLGDLAGFTSAIVLAMIALLIGYEAITRLISPVAISFDEAIPIAVLGLLVNVASVLLLSGGGRHVHHGHSHDSGTHDHHHDDAQRVETPQGEFILDIHEQDGPPRFRLSFEKRLKLDPRDITIETVRPEGTKQVFALVDRGNYLESIDEIPEPHSLVALVRRYDGAEICRIPFDEQVHAHGSAHRDNNMRSAIIHVLADAAVSMLVIIGLLLGRFFGWVWMDPAVGMCGAVVIAAWAFGLVRDTGAILLDMNPDRDMAERMRAMIEADGDRLTDLHLWRLGPGHLGAIVSIATAEQRGVEHYRQLLTRFRALSHVTVEVWPS
jgi:cation diffusion facilitator family transporter